MAGDNGKDAVPPVVEDPTAKDIWISGRVIDQLKKKGILVYETPEIRLILTSKT